MRCQHCTAGINAYWQEHTLFHVDKQIPWKYRAALCPECNDYIIELLSTDANIGSEEGEFSPFEWVRIYPVSGPGANRREQSGRPSGLRTRSGT